jgi:hypothetical protein
MRAFLKFFFYDVLTEQSWYPIINSNFKTAKNDDGEK